jgi:hypothetical protein
MLRLEPTTLFYYNLTFRSFDKANQAGLINDWVADIAPGKVGKSKATGSVRSATTKSSTLVSTTNKGKSKVPARKSKLKPLSEPLRLITTSDEEWLRSGPKQPKNSASTK